MNEKVLHKILKEICLEKNIDIKPLSFNWVWQLKKDNKIRYFCSNKADLNTEASGNIICDKYATYSVLKQENIPVIKHEILFNEKTRKNYTYINKNSKGMNQYLRENNNQIILKANNSYGGKDVYLCTSISDIENAKEKLFRRNDSISLCPFYDLTAEYRVFYIDGQCLYVYEKVRPFIIGDGKSTLVELIKDDYEIDKRLKLNYIPKLNEKITVSWKFNLSKRAKPKKIEDEQLKQKLFDLAKKAANAININYATIDIVKDKLNNFMILELNSGIVMTKFIDNTENGYEIAKNIYEKAIYKLFK